MWESSMTVNYEAATSDGSMVKDKGHKIFGGDAYGLPERY